MFKCQIIGYKKLGWYLGILQTPKITWNQATFKEGCLSSQRKLLLKLSFPFEFSKLFFHDHKFLTVLGIWNHRFHGFAYP